MTIRPFVDFLSLARTLRKTDDTTLERAELCSGGRNRRAFHVLCFCRRVREEAWSVFMKRARIG